MRIKELQDIDDALQYFPSTVQQAAWYATPLAEQQLSRTVSMYTPIYSITHIWKTKS